MTTGMNLWLVAFQRHGTSMESRCLVQAPSAEVAERLAVESWNTPYVSLIDGQVYPIEKYDNVVVEKHEPDGPILRWWEEPR